MKIKENIEGIPPYVPGAKVLGKEKLSSNENPLGSSPMAIKAIKEIDNYSVYPDGSCKLLRESLANKHKICRKAEYIHYTNNYQSPGFLI